MICTDMCQDLYNEIIEVGPRGNIHSIFENSFNILDENQNIITFLNSNGAMAPNSLKISNNISFNNLDLKKELKVNFFKDFALIEELNIKIYYNKARFYDKNPDLKFKKDNKKNIYFKLEKMRDFLFEYGNRHGIYSLLFKEETLEKDSDKFIEPRFLKFMEDFTNKNIGEISISTKNIIGYGIGLTPSMDDFISGLMISEVYLNYYLENKLETIYYLNRQIISEIDNRTTIISREMLKYAALGQSNEYIKELMVSFLGGFPIKGFENNLRKVISIGETSGTDILLGIYIDSCILLYGLRGNYFE